MRKPTTEVDPARSAQMAKIKWRDTKPEMRVRRALHAAGLRYRLHVKDLGYSPPIAQDRDLRAWLLLASSSRPEL